MSRGMSTPEETGRKPVSSLSDQKRRETIAAWLFLAPDALGLLIFVALPMILSLSLGFFEVSGFGDYKFVGLANYRRLFNDHLFLQCCRNTLVYVGLLVPTVFVVSLFLAVLLRRPHPLNGLLRGMFFVPYVISIVVVGLVWKYILIDRIGVGNRMLAKLGIPSQSWLGDPDWALYTVVAITVWFLMGYYMIIFLAGLQEIPLEYYDAARIDGASGLQTFRDITLPLLKPTSFFVALILFVSAIAGVQGFDLVYVMTKGGPANSTSLVIFFTYQQAFQYGQFGYAAASASVLVVALVLLTGFMFYVTKGGRFDYD